MKTIFLTAIILILSGCQHFQAKKRSLFFIDSDRLTCREWTITDDRPKMKMEFVAEHPLKHCNTFIAIQPVDFKEGQAAWESQFKQKDK